MAKLKLALIAIGAGILAAALALAKAFSAGRKAEKAKNLEDTIEKVAEGKRARRDHRDNPDDRSRVSKFDRK